MEIITDFTGWPPEKILAYCHQVLGVRERTPEEWEAYYKAEELKEKRHQEYLKGLYELGDCDVYKKACPVCGTIFYTCNERRIYDDYYKCSRYQHRESAKMDSSISSTGFLGNRRTTIGRSVFWVRLE